MYIINPQPSTPLLPLKKISGNNFNIFSQFYSFCTREHERALTSINGVNKRKGNIGHGGMYRSNAFGIDYVQYKPFIEIRL